MTACPWRQRWDPGLHAKRVAAACSPVKRALASRLDPASVAGVAPKDLPLERGWHRCTLSAGALAGQRDPEGNGGRLGTSQVCG